MRAFAILALPATVLALAPVEHAGGPQIPPPSVSQPLFTANTTTTITPITTTSSIGNLSITKTTSSRSSVSQSITIITTSLPNGGGLVTSTQFVAPSSTVAPTTSAGTGTTQPGAASKVGNSAIGALALAVGVGAIFL